MQKPLCTDLNGDPRFDWQETDLYELLVRVPGDRRVESLIGVLDSQDGGYIAFATGPEQADRLVEALDLYHAKD